MKIEREKMLAVSSQTQKTGSSAFARAGACNDEGETHCPAVLGRPPISSRMFSVCDYGYNSYVGGMSGLAASQSSIPV